MVTGRLSDIMAFCCKEPYCTFFSDGVVLCPSPKLLPKVSSGFHDWQSVLPAFPPSMLGLEESELCKLYLKSIRQQFQKSEALFVYPKGHLGMGGDGELSSLFTRGSLPPQEICAHSTSADSSSWGDWSKVLADIVYKAASCSSLNTFNKHYELNVASSQSSIMGMYCLLLCTDVKKHIILAAPGVWFLPSLRSSS